MKVLITFLFVIVSNVLASDIHEYAAPATVVNEARVTTGVSSQSRAQDNQGNYAFAYKEDHAEGGTFRKEEGNSLGQVIGSYGLREADGRVRIVNYVADDVHVPVAVVAEQAPHVVEDVYAAPAQQAIAVEAHGQVAEPLVAAPHAQPQVALSAPVAVEAHGPILQGPIGHAGPAVGHGPIALAPRVEAPAQLIKTYATSIYGPSLLTDNILFGKSAVAAHIPAQDGPYVRSYVPPLNSPAAYGVPAALQTHDGAGFYEPTLVYSNPSSIGYALGTNVGQFGYQLTYRKKKK